VAYNRLLRQYKGEFARGRHAPATLPRDGYKRTTLTKTALQQNLEFIEYIATRTAGHPVPAFLRPAMEMGAASASAIIPGRGSRNHRRQMGDASDER
jgi:hypothetical protein